MKYTSSYLHHETAKVLNASREKPVIITHYQKDTFIILTHKEYMKMKGKIKELKGILAKNKG